MFRMWGKIIKDNHLVKDTTICISDYSLSRTQMVFQSLDDICYEFDLSKPIWLDSNIHDFQLHAKTISHGRFCDLQNPFKILRLVPLDHHRNGYCLQYLLYRRIR